MIRLAILLVALLALMLLFRMAIKGKAKEATLEEARTIGLQEAEGHIQSPILLEDYAEARGISQEGLESMVERREIPSFRWHQYTYIENRELIDIHK